MTPPDLTQPKRLDLQEGKRLLSEEQAMQEQIRALPPDTPVVVFHGPSDVTELHKWLRNNADALVAAAEDAEKLREALRALEWAQNINREAEHCVECGGVRLGCGECGAEGSFTRYPDGSTTEPQHKPGCPIDAALTPPEPLSAQQATP